MKIITKQRNRSRKGDHPFFAIGLVLVCIGIIWNEWILAQIFSSDGVLSTYTRVKIWIFDITLILIGFAFIKGKKTKEIILQFNQSHPTQFNFLISVVLTVIMLLGAEWGVFYALNNSRQKDIETTYSEQLVQNDEFLGYKARPNVQVSAIKKFNGKVVYDVTYSIDGYSRRITPVKNPEIRSTFILFFGGSYTLGEGTNDNETIPFYVSEFAPNYRPYNYGFRGYGPQQMLAKLQSYEIIKEVEVNGGHAILVYVFQNSHINRAIGSMYTSGWTHQMPYYLIDSNDNLIRKGSFESGRPVVTFLYRLARSSELVKYSGITFPRIREEHIRITARIIEESRNTFREKFHSDDFYVLIHPGSGFRGRRLIPYFESAGIKYLDYSNLIDRTKKKFRLQEGDGSHPTALSHKIVAERLVKDIGIGEGEENRSLKHYQKSAVVVPKK